MGTVQVMAIPSSTIRQRRQGFRLSPAVLPREAQTAVSGSMSGGPHEEAHSRTQGLNVSALGLGCMGMTGAYGVSDEAEASRPSTRRSILASTSWTRQSSMAPTKTSGCSAGLARGRRDRAVIATKFGFTVGATGKPFGLDSRPQHIKDVCDQSLSRLGIEHIDLFYQHRVDRLLDRGTDRVMAEVGKAGED